MPIILPKCPDNYDLDKDKCRCKRQIKKTVKKAKKKKVKKAVKKTVKKSPKKVKKIKKSKTVKKPVNSLLYRIQQAKKMLESNLITQKEFDDIKEKIKKEKIKKEKKNTEKCTLEKRRLCVKKNKICNNKTGRCINPPKEKRTKRSTKKKKQPSKKLTKTKKKKILADKLKTLTLTKQRSYSPTINEEIDRLAITPHDDLFTSICKEDQINIAKNYLDSGRCVGWKTKKAKQYLLENLRSKKKIDAEDIIGPNQSWDNCWFNTFFMMFFISDKGRKFMKAFRETMITGILPGKKSKAFPDGLRYPFWLLNKFITASLIGRKDIELYASMMDTNDIIKKIYKKLKKYSGKKEVDYFTITNVKQAGNPISMFLSILNYFYTQHSIRGFGVSTYRISHSYQDFMQLSKKNSTGTTYKYILEKKPHIVIIDFSDVLSNGKKPNGKEAKVKDFKKKRKFKIGNLEYKLDSVGIRDNNKHHICALVTLNGNDYMFDGENHTPLYKRKWRHLLNKNENFKITDRISEQYNLTKGYQCLLYYRTK